MSGAAWPFYQPHHPTVSTFAYLEAVAGAPIDRHIRAVLDSLWRHGYLGGSELAAVSIRHRLEGRVGPGRLDALVASVRNLVEHGLLAGPDDHPTRRPSSLDEALAGIETTRRFDRRVGWPSVACLPRTQPGHDSRLQQPVFATAFTPSSQVGVETVDHAFGWPVRSNQTPMTSRQSTDVHARLFHHRRRRRPSMPPPSSTITTRTSERVFAADFSRVRLSSPSTDPDAAGSELAGVFVPTLSTGQQDLAVVVVADSSDPSDPPNLTTSGSREALEQEDAPVVLGVDDYPSTSTDRQNEPTSQTEHAPPLVRSPSPPANDRAKTDELMEIHKDVIKQLVEEDEFMEYDNVESSMRRYRRLFYHQHTSDVRAALASRRQYSDRLMFSRSRQNAVNLEKRSPFGSLSVCPVDRTTGAGGTEKTVQAITNELLVGTAGRSAKSVGRHSVEIVTADSITLPEFIFYTPMEQNRFTTGSNELTYWPYFKTDRLTHGVVSEGLYDDLNHMFISLCDGRQRYLRLLDHCRTQERFLDRFVAEVGCEWSCVMRVMLEHSPSECRRRGYLETIKDEDVCAEDFGRESHRWRPFLHNLPAFPSDRARTVAGLVCQSHLAVYGISIWPIVRRKIPLESLQTKLSVAELWPNPCQPDVESDGEVEYQFDGLACDVCHLHFCTSHGKFLPDPDPSKPLLGAQFGPPVDTRPDGNADEEEGGNDESMDDDGMDDDQMDDDGGLAGVSRYALSYHPSTRSARLNRRVRVADGLQPSVDGPTVEPAGKKRKTRLSYADRANGTAILHRRPAFLPCQHEGRCEDNRCSCFMAGILCEKYCRCNSGCEYRYRGCSCRHTEPDHHHSNGAEGAGKKTCFLSNKCTCFSLNRECDPDLCHGCGAVHVLDPAHRHVQTGPATLCSNVHMQLDRPARTLVGVSLVHGLGLFAAEMIEQGTYLGEYKGELVSRGESDRRGVVYHYNTLVYLFTLNQEQDVDSGQFGNRLRFINHASRVENTNVQTRVFFHNGSFHIAMFARRDIPAGEELFFNYGYPSERKKGFVEPGDEVSASEAEKAGSSGTVERARPKKSRRLSLSAGPGRPSRQSRSRTGGRTGVSPSGLSGPSGLSCLDSDDEEGLSPVDDPTDLFLSSGDEDEPEGVGWDARPDSDEEYVTARPRNGRGRTTVISAPGTTTSALSEGPSASPGGKKSTKKKRPRERSSSNRPTTTLTLSSNTPFTAPTQARKRLRLLRSDVGPS